MDGCENYREIENTYVCLECGIQYSITVDEVLHNPETKCQRCGCTLMLLEDQKLDPIC